MTYFQRCFYIVSLVFVISAGSVSAQYWERITAVPSTYQNTYWLDVFFLPSNPKYGWISGFNGHVLRTIDSGKTWNGATVPFPPSANGQLESIHFTTPDTGYTSGAQGTGIFKTVNGGATWLDISPPQTRNFWGTYFLNSDTGLVLGGTCGIQEFYFTKDGGNSWQQFRLNTPGSALTDAIIYPDGRALAIGSGFLYESADFGQTWVVASTTGPAYWHEELAVAGSTVLVPVAGNTCSGQGNSGGIRTFNGAWTEFNTGQPMFASFLINSQKGWGGGNNRAVYYTSDGGRRWELRNCGITDHIDDIWFVTENIGWAVGGGTQSGSIYKYSPAKRSLSKTTLDLGTTCTAAQDTTWLINKSFLPVVTQLSINGDADFTVLSPTATTLNIPACDSIRIITRLNTLTAGPKALNINISFPEFPIDLLALKIRATVKRQEASLTKDTVVINPAPVGKLSTGITYFLNKGIDPSTVTFVGRISGSAEIIPEPIIQPITIAPVTPSAQPTVRFNVTPSDTGWIETRFRVRLTESCPIDTFVTVRVYGVSPIITAPRLRTFSIACSPDKYDTIPVKNTGNAPLLISSANITGSADFSIIGWLRDPLVYPRTIAPGESDSVVILFKTSQPIPGSAILSLINNDSTKINGTKTPYDIQLKASVLLPQISVLKEIDLGRVCVREEDRRSFYVVNSGNETATVSEIFFDKANFTINAGNQLIPSKDSLLVTVIFKPQKSGVINDSIVIISDPCGGRNTVMITATAIETKLEFTPNEIFKEIRTGERITEEITVISTGTTAANIRSIRLEPATRTDMRLVQIPSPLPVLQPGEMLKFAIEFDPQTDTTFDGKIVIETAPQCLAFFQMNFFVRSSSTRLQFFESALSFTDELCVPDSSYDTLTFKNASAIPVNIKSIEVPNDNYTVISPLSQNLEIKPDSTEKIIVRYSFKSPSSDDTLKIQTDEPTNSDKPFLLKVKTIETIRPQMTFKNLDLGNLRLDSFADGFVEISNYTNYTQTITNITTEPANTELQITLPQTPLILAPGSTVKIPVHFDALKIDTVGVVLKVASEIFCSDTNEISVIARVPYIQYPFVISIGDYSATPPDTVDIPVVIENSFTDAIVNSISLKILFNEKLAYPLEVLSNTRQQLPYTFKNDVLDITIDRNSFTKMPLGEAGELFTMRVLAMPRSPFSTKLDIDTVIISSRYDAIPVLKDGSLTVEYCLPITGFNLLPTFQAAVISNGGNSVQCEINSTGEQNITFELIDIFGISHSLKTDSFTKGASTIEIPTAELSSGTYFLKAQSSTGTLERMKITLVK
ncbi:MAG: choice-of-anchor D domain-containing protein [Bacteroidota bacterium]